MSDIDAYRGAKLSPNFKNKFWVLFALCVVAISIAVFWAQHNVTAPLTPVTKVTIAMPTQINSAPVIIASSQGLFQKAGVEVVTQPFLLGKDALKSVLDNKADLALVADTPFMLSWLGGSDIAIIAGVSQARRSLAIVAHPERGINQMTDLIGKSIGLTLGTNLPYFLDSMLQAHKVPSDKVLLRDMKVDAAIRAFKEKQIDAAVVFQPFLAQLQMEMGEQFKVFYGEDIYAFRFLLVGKKNYIESHPQEIQRVLRALIAANQSIKTDPIKARHAVGEVVKVDDAIMSKLFDPDDYLITLDQAMLIALDDQTRWAMKNGTVKPGPVPNYLNSMKWQNLEVVRPDAVKIVR